MSEPARLHPLDLELLADLVAERVARKLADGQVAPPSPEMVDAAEIARRFNVSREWVRDHAAELGVVRMGDGPRPRLRFDVERVREVLTRRSAGVRSPEPEMPGGAGGRPGRRPRRSANDRGALPVRQLAPAITGLSSRSTTEKVGRRRANGPPPATRMEPSPRSQRNDAAPAAGPSPSRHRKETAR